MQQPFSDKKTLKRYISENRLEEAVKKLLYQVNEFLENNEHDEDYMPVRKLEDALIINSGKLKNLEHDKIIGVTDGANYHRITTEVQIALLHILDRLPAHFWSFQSQSDIPVPLTQKFEEKTLDRVEINLAESAPSSESRESDPQVSTPLSKQNSSKEKKLQNYLSDKFISVKGGTFLMGSHGNEKDREVEETRHEVKISDFFIAKYTVTQGEYILFTNKPNPSGYKDHFSNPVEKVTWFDAIHYCNLLNKKYGYKPVYNTKGELLNHQGKVSSIVSEIHGFRLPTEAEWEYACRAGTTTPFNTGKNLTTDQANFDGSDFFENNRKGRNLKKTTPVGSYLSNNLGIYDMHGNVWEWCHDWYSENYYLECKQTGLTENPIGPLSGFARVLRGGSWHNPASVCRSASRIYAIPSNRNNSWGFRVVFVP